jgi:hypothetical protein
VARAADGSDAMLRTADDDDNGLAIEKTVRAEFEIRPSIQCEKGGRRTNARRHTAGAEFEIRTSFQLRRRRKGLWYHAYSLQTLYRHSFSLGCLVVGWGYAMKAKKVFVTLQQQSSNKKDDSGMRTRWYLGQDFETRFVASTYYRRCSSFLVSSLFLPQTIDATTVATATATAVAATAAVHSSTTMTIFTERS